MGMDVLFVGYGCVSKTWERGMHYRGAAFKEWTEKTGLSDDPEGYGKINKICIYSPYESERIFLGYAMYDGEVEMNGLPELDESIKDKVHEMYDALPLDIRAKVKRPDWVILSHYE